MVEGIRAGSESTAIATMNRMARPNDLGFKELLGALVGADEMVREEKQGEKIVVEDKKKDESVKTPVKEMLREKRKKWLGDEAV
jgi:hypothetical protein